LAVKKLLPLLEVHSGPVALPINGEAWRHDDKTGWSLAGTRMTAGDSVAEDR
jgi:hypothetical protein